MRFELLDTQLNQPSDSNIKGIVHLRKTAFKNRHGELLDPKKFEWNQKDKRSIHFFAEAENTMVSCLRLFRIETPMDFQETLLIDPNNENNVVPSFLLSRAATVQAHANSSLNLHLRLMSLEHIRKKRRNEYFLYGTSLETIRRKDLLQAMGYEFLNHSIPENLLSKNGKTMVFRLNLNFYLDHAIETLKKELRCLIV